MAQSNKERQRAYRERRKHERLGLEQSARRLEYCEQHVRNLKKIIRKLRDKLEVYEKNEELAREYDELMDDEDW